MSNENFAIEIDPPDDAEYDVEAGINSSTCHLMHSFEEERPTSLVASIKESARSSKRKVKYYCSFIFSPIKQLLATFKLLIIIGLYSFAGAHLFMYLEVPTDLEAKEDSYHQRKIAREVMVLNLRAIHYDNREDREERWKHSILKFEADMGLDEPVIETVWTFWMSFLYAGTIFTTIGYGNIACKTRAGQIATMIYAFAGIPIMLVMLTSLNNFLLKWIKIVTNGFCDILLYVGVRLGIAVIRQDEVQKRLRYTKIAKKMAEWRLAKQGAAGSIAMSSSEENRLNSSPDDEDEEDMEPDPPVFSTLFATVSWIMLSAAVFCLFEDWTFFTSFYFCFISLTTIGLGDVTPANPEYMIATFGVVIIGLSMLTVCIDVIKEKLALMYMALLQKLLKDYLEAVKNGDPNAANLMMAGFQGKAKFLMPLISKNEGSKVMDKFKQDCSKKGIDPPPVLTNINPETGMPAFANASRQDFNDYIEVAEERFAEEQQQRLIAQTPLSKSSDFLQPPSRKGSVTVPVPMVSLEVQAGTTMGKFHDYGIQTQNESSDEGIQTDYSLDFDADFKKKEPERIMADAGTQYEIVLLTSIGIQPEVSSIYIGAEASSAEDEESGCESEEEYSTDEEELPFDVEDPGVLAFGLQSPPIEITPFTDDESGTSSKLEEVLEVQEVQKMVAIPTKLIPAKVSKSASMDSTDTVIHVKPSEESKEGDVGDFGEEKKPSQEKEKKKRKKKLKTKKTREHELRFLKNSGNQTSPILLDCSTQYEIFTTESSSQYDVKGRSRKCQTKLSSINHEQLQGIRETVQKLKRRESEMSRVTNVSERLESESDWDIASESGKEPEVAEVSLDLSVIALGVDETGKVVEVPQAPPQVPKTSKDPSQSSQSSKLDLTEDPKQATSPSESTSMVHLDSDDEEIESLEELEMYTTDSGAQTEEKVMVDQQAQITPKILEIIKNSTTQTTFSTFHLPQKVYESASTSEDEEKDDDDRVEKSKSEVFFMTNTGVQTMQTSFHMTPRNEEKEKEKEVPMKPEGVEKVEESVVQKSEETEPDDLPLFLKDSDCQTVALGSFTTATSTEDVRFAEQKDVRNTEMQTVEQIFFNIITQTEETIREDGGYQTDRLEASAAETQTEPTKSLEAPMQTDTLSMAPVECQTDFPVEKEEPQKPETSTSMIQTDPPSCAEVEVQALVSVDSSPVECQTEAMHYDEVEVQTEIDSWTTWVQTEFVAGDDVEMQTEENETMASECQTEGVSVDDIEMQTDQQLVLPSVQVQVQTDAVNTDLQYTQTDEEPNPRAPTEHAFTQYESKVIDSQTQYTTMLEDVDVQATPISLDTQTQHSIELDAKSCQTEHVLMKNKRSQDEENESLDRSSINLSPIPLDVTHSFTMTEPGSSEEKEVQVDESSFEDVTKPKYISGPLWSDFDYTPVFGEEDEEVVDGETQTENGSEGEVVEDALDQGDQKDPEEKGSKRTSRAKRASVTSSKSLGEEEEEPEEVEQEEHEEPTTSMTPGAKKSKKVTKSKRTKSSKTPTSSEDPTQLSEETLESSAPTSKRTSSSTTATSSSTTDPPLETDKFAVQSAPESSDVKIQTVKFKKSFKKKRAEEKNVEARVEMSTSTVQATTEMCEQSAGSPEDDWLQVYVQELDEERRLRMSDIGIQTGVLARVQHMYTLPISDDVGASSSAPITLRKSSDSSEHISTRTAKSSEESLVKSVVKSVSGTAISASESMDDHLWPERASPFASRHASLKRRKREPEGEKKTDKTNIVHNLLAKFEMKSPPKSPKDEEGSSSKKSFF